MNAIPTIDVTERSRVLHTRGAVIRLERHTMHVYRRTSFHGWLPAQRHTTASCHDATTRSPAHDRL